MVWRHWDRRPGETSPSMSAPRPDDPICDRLAEPRSHLWVKVCLGLSPLCNSLTSAPAIQSSPSLHRSVESREKGKKVSCCSWFIVCFFVIMAQDGGVGTGGEDDCYFHDRAGAGCIMGSCGILKSDSFDWTHYQEVRFRILLWYTYKSAPVFLFINSERCWLSKVYFS